MSYLAVTKAKGHTYYKIMESYRDESGKTKHRVVYNIGTARQLLDLIPPSVYESKTEPVLQEEQIDQQLTIDLKPVRCRTH